ncbi:MAG: hypothetical protein ACREEB_16075 [Caulobacteraceae bacterium]
MLRIRALALSLMVTGLAWAGGALGQCTLPNELTNGQTADASQVMANFNALAACIEAQPPGPGSLIDTLYLTGSGAYTPTGGTNSIIVELVGGGAGGAGVPASGSGQSSQGQGGQGGGWLKKRLTSGFSGASYSVGSGGAGGAAGAHGGAAGGNTTFGGLTAMGGAATGPGIGPYSSAWQYTPSVTLNSTTGGDIDRDGGQPGLAINTSAGNANTSHGGDSVYSPGAPMQFTPTGGAANGANAGGYGGGGASGSSLDGGGAAAGGNGSSGIIIVYEYR